MKFWDLEEAHKHCFRNRVEVEASSLCGCFYCEKTFAPSEITEWTDENQTAFCPKCSIDSVIGTASGYPIKAAFSKAMNEKYF